MSSHLNILSFKYNLLKLRFKPGRLLSSKDRQFSDWMKTYKPDDEEMKEVFNKIANRPGKIPTQRGKIFKEDLRWMLESFGKADAVCEAKRMLCAADSKKDGYIDLDEFMEVHKNGMQLGDIRRAFFVFDNDEDGRISAEEVMAVLHKLGENCSLEQCRRMVKEIDRNHDGFVDMDDFMTMMTRPRKKP